MRKTLSNYLKRIVFPGFIPNHWAIIVSYITTLLIFPIDVTTGSRIALHLLYLFPLLVISLHCKQLSYVNGAVALAILVQVLTLLSYTDDTIDVKIFMSLMLSFVDIIVVLITRYVRYNTIEVQRLSTTDPLTRLFNRRALKSAIDIELNRQKRYGGEFSLVLIDLDGFKSVNDTMGHQAGDQALILMADLLRSHTRESDLAFRIGGDEFVVVMPNTTVEDCEHMCNNLCRTIAENMIKNLFAITASIGYTTIEKPPESDIDILTIADRAMYQAKSNGKSCIVRGFDASTSHQQQIS